MAKSDIITGQYVQISQTPASVGERIGAQLIDWVAQGVYLSLGIELLRAIPGSHVHLRLIIEMLVMTLPVLFYSPLCELLAQGQTIGKRLLKMRVVRRDGSMPTLGSALLRWMLFLVDGPMLSGVGVLVMLLTPHRQRLGDLAAGTLVIKLESYDRLLVSLDEFSHLSRNYRPVYPQAADLTQEQVNLIHRAVAMDDDDPRVHALAAKVQQVLGIHHIHESSDHVFLFQLECDYQHYALEEI